MREITVQLDARCQSSLPSAYAVNGRDSSCSMRRRLRAPDPQSSGTTAVARPSFELSAGRASELTRLPPGAVASLPLLKLPGLGLHEPEHFSPGSTAYWVPKTFWLFDYGSIHY